MAERIAEYTSDDCSVFLVIMTGYCAIEELTFVYTFIYNYTK